MAREVTTAGRRQAKAYNERHGWSYSYGAVERLIRQHHDGTEDTRARIEYQLDDANWHTIAEDLSKNNYADAQKHNDADWDDDEKDKKARKTTYQNGYVEPARSKTMSREERNKRQNERRKEKRAQEKARREAAMNDTRSPYQRFMDARNAREGRAAGSSTAAKGNGNG